MTFFEDLEKKINKAGQVVVDKASSIVDSSKLSYQVSSEEKALSELYRQLGFAYYTNREQLPNAQTDSLCDSIRQKVELIASLRRQEAASRGKRHCPNCGSECDIYQPFCYVCHAELAPMSAPGMKRCPNCHQDIPEESLFCTNCGSKMDTEA